MDDLRNAWQDGLISSAMIGWDEIENWHAHGKEFCMADLREKYPLVTDVVKEMAWWACFEKDRKTVYRAKAAGVPEAFLAGTGLPTRRIEPKVGRNDRCPCGNGKKFKKCCGR